MINIYLSDNKVQLIQGTSGANIKIKELYYTIVDTSLSNVVLKFLKKVECTPKIAVNIIIDSPQVMTKEELLPCVRERDLRSIIENKGVQTGQPVDNTVDEVMEVIRKHEHVRMQTYAKTTVAPTAIMKELERIVKAYSFKLGKIMTAQECVAKYIDKFWQKYYPGCMLLLSYKNYFATISIFNEGKEIFSENLSFQSADNEMAFKRIVDLSHRGIMNARAEYGLYIEKVYVVGDVNDFENMQSAIEQEIGMDCEQIPLIKEIKGVSTTEFNEFFASIGSLI